MKNKDYFISVPRTTLEAVKGLLYGPNGTDLSGVANDLFEEGDELGRIHLALAFNKKLPKWDMTPRYGSHTRYVPVRYSMVTQQVWVDEYDWSSEKGEYIKDTWNSGKPKEISWFLDLPTEDPHAPAPSDAPAAPDAPAVPDPK